MFESLSDRLQTVFQKLGSKGKLTEDDVREGMKQVINSEIRITDYPIVNCKLYIVMSESAWLL